MYCFHMLRNIKLHYEIFPNPPAPLPFLLTNDDKLLRHCADLQSVVYVVFWHFKMPKKSNLPERKCLYTERLCALSIPIGYIKQLIGHVALASFNRKPC